MLELLFLPVAVLPLHPPADDLIHTQYTTISAPPSLLHSAGHSLHRSAIDMSSIHHAPTAEDYLHPTAALASTYRHLPPASALHSSVHLLQYPPPPPGSVLPPVETLR